MLEKQVQIITEEEEGIISQEQVIEVVEEVKLQKAPDRDKTSPEMMKCIDTEGIKQMIVSIFNCDNQEYKDTKRMD